MSRYRRYRRYGGNNEPPIVYLIGGILLVLSWLFYHLIGGLVSLVKWVWKTIKKPKKSEYDHKTYVFTPVEDDETTEINAITNPIPESKSIEQKPIEKPKYFKKHSLLTPAEDNFYKVLEKIAQENSYIIQTKVRLEGLIGVDFYAENWWGLRNRIKSREMDFVLCEKRDSSLNPVLIIELDDSSHQRADRIERDKNLNHVLEEAGLPILHISTAYSYNPNDLLIQIKEKIG